MLSGMRSINSTAIGCRIEAVSYDADTGYLVMKLDSGEELWISADWCGYHVLLDTPGDSSTCLQLKRISVRRLAYSVVGVSV